MIRYSPDKVVFGALFVLAYAFSLRLLSEALPAVLECGDRKVDAQAVLKFEGAEAVLRLKRRKNRLFGGQLRRKCWRTTSPLTCPFHVLREASTCCGHGGALFPGVTAAAALRVLREILEELCVPFAGEYRTQDFRRGHTEDLRAAGILRLLYMPACVDIRCLSVGTPVKKILESGD